MRNPPATIREIVERKSRPRIPVAASEREYGQHMESTNSPKTEIIAEPVIKTPGEPTMEALEPINEDFTTDLESCTKDPVMEGSPEAMVRDIPVGIAPIKLLEDSDDEVEADDVESGADDEESDAQADDVEFDVDDEELDDMDDTGAFYSTDDFIDREAFMRNMGE